MTYANQGSVPSQRRRWTEPEAAYGPAHPAGQESGAHTVHQGAYRAPQPAEGHRMPPGGEGHRVPPGAEGHRVPQGADGHRVPHPTGAYRDTAHTGGDGWGSPHPTGSQPYGAGGPAGTGMSGDGAGHRGDRPEAGGHPGGTARPGTPGAPGGSPWPEAGPEQHDRAAAEIRNLVVDRLSQMNAQHALNAWEHRRRTPIGPHALAFFYLDVVESGGGPARYVTPAAARLFLDGEDVAFLPELLYKMVGIGRRRLARGDDFDPMTTMARRQDEMSARAQYIGVGVSSLETPSLSWTEVQQKAFGPLDIPGRGMALLSDGTRLVLERGDHAHGPMHVRSTHQLDLVPGIPSRRWTWLRDTVEPNSAEYWLNELHQTVLEGQRRMEERSRRRPR